MSKKRIVLLSLFILTVILAVGLRINYKYTIATDQKQDDIGASTYGYKIEQYSWRNDSILTIWLNRGTFPFTANIMTQRYYFPTVTIDKVHENWYQNNSILYLNLETTYQDSLKSYDRIKVLYDFHKGELHVYSGLTLWRFFDTKNSFETWTSEAEFNKILDKAKSP